MTISRRAWVNYVKALRKVDETAAREMFRAIQKYGLENNDKLIKVAYDLATEYGEVSGDLACEMYDMISYISSRTVPHAVRANTATYAEVAKAVNGTIKYGNEQIVSNAVGNLVKLVSVDTMQQNALRDGAEWAWIPNGDSCAFCLTLASQGWQRASKKAIKNGHAEHIHANCDCSYCVRFDENTDVAGYDPEKYKKIYYDHDGDINAIRRDMYEQNKDEINAQKRAAYAAKKEREQG